MLKNILSKHIMLMLFNVTNLIVINIVFRPIIFWLKKEL